MHEVLLFKKRVVGNLMNRFKIACKSISFVFSGSDWKTVNSELAASVRRFLVSKLLEFVPKLFPVLVVKFGTSVSPLGFFVNND